MAEDTKMWIVKAKITGTKFLGREGHSMNCHANDEGNG